VSVQAREDFSTAGQWFWDNRLVTSNAGAAWQNPGGGFGAGCLTWGRKTSRLPIQNGPDQLFRLVGTIGSATPTPTATVTPATYATDYFDTTAPSHAGAAPDSLALIRPLEKTNSRVARLISGEHNLPAILFGASSKSDFSDASQGKRCLKSADHTIPRKFLRKKS
jgi:hypothetical protein